MNKLKVGDRVNIDLAYQWWYARHGQGVNMVQQVGSFGWRVKEANGIGYLIEKDNIEARIPARFISKAIEQAE